MAYAQKRHFILFYIINDRMVHSASHLRPISIMYAVFIN
jgi:hypothetical protein